MMNKTWPSPNGVFTVKICWTSWIVVIMININKQKKGLMSLNIYRWLHFKKETLRLHVLMEIFWVIIVSTRIHFLLRSTFQWRSFRFTTPWGLNYSHLTWLFPRMPPQFVLAGLKVFRIITHRLGIFVCNERLITM